MHAYKLPPEQNLARKKEIRYKPLGDSMIDLNLEIWNEERLLELLKLDKSTLSRLIRDEKFPIIRLGNKRAFLAVSVLRWMRDRESVGKWEGRGRKVKDEN